MSICDQDEVWTLHTAQEVIRVLTMVQDARPTLALLPIELQTLILQELDPESLQNAALSCRPLHNAYSESRDLFWTRLLRRVRRLDRRAILRDNGQENRNERSGEGMDTRERSPK